MTDCNTVMYDYTKSREEFMIIKRSLNIKPSNIELANTVAGEALFLKDFMNIRPEMKFNLFYSLKRHLALLFKQHVGAVNTRLRAAIKRNENLVREKTKSEKDVAIYRAIVKNLGISNFSTLGLADVKRIALAHKSLKLLEHNNVENTERAIEIMHEIVYRNSPKSILLMLQEYEANKSRTSFDLVTSNDHLRHSCVAIDNGTSDLKRGIADWNNMMTDIRKVLDHLHNSSDSVHEIVNTSEEQITKVVGMISKMGDNITSRLMDIVAEKNQIEGEIIEWIQKMFTLLNGDITYRSNNLNETIYETYRSVVSLNNELDGAIGTVSNILNAGRPVDETATLHDKVKWFGSTLLSTSKYIVELTDMCKIEPKTIITNLMTMIPADANPDHYLKRLVAESWSKNPLDDILSIKQYFGITNPETFISNNTNINQIVETYNNIVRYSGPYDPTALILNFSRLVNELGKRNVVLDPTNPEGFIDDLNALFVMISEQFKMANTSTEITMREFSNQAIETLTNLQSELSECKLKLAHKEALLFYHDKQIQQLTEERKELRELDAGNMRTLVNDMIQNLQLYSEHQRAVDIQLLRKQFLNFMTNMNFITFNKDQKMFSVPEIDFQAPLSLPSSAKMMIEDAPDENVPSSSGSTSTAVALSNVSRKRSSPTDDDGQATKKRDLIILP